MQFSYIIRFNLISCFILQFVELRVSTSCKCHHLVLVFHLRHSKVILLFPLLTALLLSFLHLMIILFYIKKIIKPLDVSKICVECHRKGKGSAPVLRSRIYHSLSLYRYATYFCFEAYQIPSPMILKSSVIAFSRNERTHPNLVSQAREIEIFWTANWPPL